MVAASVNGNGRAEDLTPVGKRPPNPMLFLSLCMFGSYMSMMHWHGEPQAHLQPIFILGMPIWL